MYLGRLGENYRAYQVLLIVYVPEYIKEGLVTAIESTRYSCWYMYLYVHDEAQ